MPYRYPCRCYNPTDDYGTYPNPCHLVMSYAFQPDLDHVDLSEPMGQFKKIHQKSIFGFLYNARTIN